MPEISLETLPKILKENKEIHQEINLIVKKYLKDIHLSGWQTIQGAKRWIRTNHIFVQAPINDMTLGGFIFFKENKNIFYINTWQPRVYQNFVLFHEIYHYIEKFSVRHETDDFFHIVELEQNQDSQEERKADYFSSLVLMDKDEIIPFFQSLKNESMEERIFYTMERFMCPYKAVLIRLFELGLIENNVLEEFFDKRFKLESEFMKLGLDPSPVQKSLVIEFGDLEDRIDNSLLPEIAKERNKETLENIKDYFSRIS